MKAQGSKGSLKNNNCYLNILTQVFIKLLNVSLLKFIKILTSNLFYKIWSQKPLRPIVWCFVQS